MFWSLVLASVLFTGGKPKGELPNCVNIWNNTKHLMKKKKIPESHKVIEPSHIRFYYGPEKPGSERYLVLVMAEIKPDLHVAIPDTLILAITSGVCKSKKGSKYLFRLDLVKPHEIPKKA